MAGMITEWVTVSDFSPGIVGDFHGAAGQVGNTTRGSVLRDGAATVEHTYACHADSSGALVPLPQRTTAATQTLLPAGNAYASSSYYPTLAIGAFLLDAHAISSTSPSASVQAAIMGLWGFQFNTSGAGTNYKGMFLGRMFRLPAGTTYDFFWETTAVTSVVNIGAGGLVSSQGTVGAGYPIPASNVSPCVAIAASFGIGSGTHASAPIPGDETPLTTFDSDVSANYPSGVGGLGQGTFTIPNLAGTANSIKYLNAVNSNMGHVLPVDHQGRLCSVTDFPITTFGSLSMFSSMLGFGQPLDPNGISGGGTKGSLTLNRGLMRRPGVIASLTADELFIVGMQGGAMLVRGDIANPTVVMLPFVESTNGLAMYPAVTPIGVVYGSRNGVYAWSGGDTSKKLSTQLDGFFWDHATGEPDYYATRGRFSFWDPWVCVPNGYLFDVNADSWWRLCDPTSNSSVNYNVYTVDNRTGTMYAFPYKLTATQNVAFDSYSPSVLSSSFSWRSHPLLQSRDRMVTTQQVELVAANPTVYPANVVVTLEGVAPDGGFVSRQMTFTLTGSAVSGGRPQVLRQSVPSGAVTARYLQLRIEASNTSTSAAAPKILSIGVGLGERNRIPNAV